MDQYPEELRTPPVPLVALVGLPELHSAISMSLHKEEPPLNTLAIPDVSKVSVIGGKEKKPIDARLPPPVGILKADWLTKHRTRIPAVLALLLSSDQVCGDPAQWPQICSNIDMIKAVIRGRNTKLVIAVVQPSVKGDMTDTRLTVLRKRADVEQKNCFMIITHDPGELKRSLQKLGSILGELADFYYKEEGRRVRLRIDRKTYSSVELSVRYNFKLAVYAEFRRKWFKAVKYYRIAYSLLQEIFKAHVELLPIQKTLELKAVAENLHLKISTLLLHSGKEGDAVKWFGQHIGRYKCLIGPPEGTFLHWSWVCNQFQVFAELLDTSLATSSLTTNAEESTNQPGTTRELHPGCYLQVAASYMILRRRFFESAVAVYDALHFEEGTVDVLDGPPEDIGSPLYVGQASRLLKRGSTFDLQRPTEAEFMRHIIAVEKNFDHTEAAIVLLTRAQQEFKQTHAYRMICQISSEMGREYYNARDYARAKECFDSVTDKYRMEAWGAVLGATLGYLRECARQLGLLKDYVEYALELASLPLPMTQGPDMERLLVSGPEVGPAGPLSQSLREQIHHEVIGLMQGQTSVLPAREDENGMTVTSDSPVALEFDASSSLRIFLSAFVVFHEQVVRPGAQTSMTLSLLTHLPLKLMLLELEVHFNQPECSFILKDNESGLEGEVLNGQGEGEQLPVKTNYDLELEPCKWKNFTVDVTPNHTGRLECIAVVARIGPHATVRCRIDGQAIRSGFWVYEPGMDTRPFKPSDIDYFGQKMLQVEEEEPRVEVELVASSPGLVGEAFPVRFVVTSKKRPLEGGEMDVYLRPPAAVPRGTPAVSPFPSPPGVPPPELLRAGFEDEDAYIEFFGPLKVPSLGADEKWDTTLYLRWSEPKDVNLLALLSYQTGSNRRRDEAYNTNTSVNTSTRRRVQSMLNLRCQQAVEVSYQYISRFRTDALLPGGLHPERPTPLVTLLVDDVSILVVRIKNSSTLAVNLRSIKMVQRDPKVCSATKPGNGGDPGGILLSPEDLFEQLFYVRPLLPSTALDVGTIEIAWQRERSNETNNMLHPSDNPTDTCQSPVNTKRVSLVPVLVESPPLVFTFNCPPHALLGVPFISSMSIQNMTIHVQEVSFSVLDTTNLNFIFAGAHSDTFSILPKSAHVIPYILVPIASGLQQLPQFRFSSTRFKAGFQPSASSAHVFVLPASRADPQNARERSKMSTEPGIALET